MKKTLMTVVAALAMCPAASAQKDLHILNHLSVGAEAGTMGWGVDVSMPITRFVDVQAAGFKFDIGCVFWGKPSVYCSGMKVHDTNADGKDSGAIHSFQNH